MTELLSWSDAFAVGHDVLDAQHRGLIEAINKLCSAVLAKPGNDELCELCKSLKRAAEEHFTHENAILREILHNTDSGPKRRRRQAHLITLTGTALEAHIADHSQAFSRLEQMLEHLHIGADALAFCNDLKDWFVQHAIKHDSHLKALFQSM